MRVTGRPLLWLVWDGASHAVVHSLLARGELPALASVVRRGGLAATRPPEPNCQTPTSLASLFTGTAPERHGVLGFSMPSPDRRRPFTAARSAFSPDVLRVAPVWEEVTAAGNRVALVHAPWAGTAAAFRCDAYPRPVGGPTAVEGTATTFAVGDAEVDVAVDGDEVTVTGPTATTTSSVGNLPFEHAVDVRLGAGLGCRVTAWRRADDGRVVVGHPGAWQVEVSTCTADFEAATGPFVGRSLSDEYRAGTLGLPAFEGGSGHAERALAASLVEQARSFARASSFALRHAGGLNFAVAYQPVVDEANHEVFRHWVRGDCPDADRVLVAAYRAADDHLAALLAVIGTHWRVVVSSDHGAVPVDRAYHPNETLRQAGLLSFTAEGAVEPSASLVAYHPCRNGSVLVNGRGRADGLVDEADRADVIARAAAALRAAVDPVTGHPVVAELLPGDGRRGDDLFLVTVDGYDVRADAGPEFGPTRKGGVHVTASDSHWLRGILADTEPTAWPDEVVPNEAVLDRLLPDVAMIG